MYIIKDAQFGFLDSIGKVIDSPIANKLIEKNTKAIESVKKVARKRGQIEPPSEGYRIPKKFDPDKPINFYIHGLGGYDKKVGGNQLVDELKKSSLGKTSLGGNVIPVNPKKLRNADNPALAAQDLDRDADRVTRQILGYKKKNPNAKINVTGHSMGGNLAEKVGQRLKERGLLEDGSVKISSISGYRPRIASEAKTRLRSPNFTPLRNEAEDLPRNAFMGDEIVLKGGKGHSAKTILDNPEGQKILKRSLNLRKEIWLLADFGSPLNKRLKRAWQRSLFPNDDALSAVQKARGRKPTEVIADALSSRAQVPIDRNDPPRLTKRVIGTLKSIRESPVEISQTLYANSKTGAVPNSKLNRQLRSIGDDKNVSQKRLIGNARKKYDTEITVHNHPRSVAVPSPNDIKASIIGAKDINRKDYITGMYGFDVTKSQINKDLKNKDLKKYKQSTDKIDAVLKSTKTLEKDYNDQTKRLKERNKKLYNSYEKYGI